MSIVCVDSNVELNMYSVIELDGRKYITSRRLYDEKKAAGMTMYTELKLFNRAVKNMTTYEEMLALGHIKYVEYSQVADIIGGAILEPLLKSNSYKPILLMDAVAQQTVEQHLNDEQSKVSALGANALSAAMKTGDSSATATATLALNAQGLDPHVMMAQMNQLYAAYCQKEIEAARAEAKAEGLNKSLTGSQRNNSKLTRENTQLKEANRKLNLQATGQLEHMSIAQFCAAKGISKTKDTKRLANRMKLISQERGIEIKRVQLGNDKWATMQFQAALLNEFAEDIEAFFKA